MGLVQRGYSGAAAEATAEETTTATSFEHWNNANSVEGLADLLKEEGDACAEIKSKQIPDSPSERRERESRSSKEVLEEFGRHPKGDEVNVETPAMRVSDTNTNDATSDAWNDANLIERSAKHNREEITKSDMNSGTLGAKFPYPHAERMNDERPASEMEDIYDAYEAPISITQQQIAEQSEKKSVSPGIYILGIGPTAKLIAHSLAGLCLAPSVTLLLHRPMLFRQWYDEGENIKLVRNGKVTAQSALNIESSTDFQMPHTDQQLQGFGKKSDHFDRQPNSVIDHLIVTTEGYATLSALSSVKQRLRHSSTICFIQDGLGIVERVNSSIFKDPFNRPSYMLGNISHKLQSTERKFTVIETSCGSIALTMLPRDMNKRIEDVDARQTAPLVRRMDFGWTTSSKHLMRMFSRSPELSARGLTQQNFYKLQLEKLAITAVIGPLSVVFDCSNDQLLHNYQARRSMELLLREMSEVLRSIPELSRMSKFDDHFSPQRLERLVMSVIRKTGKNVTAMLQAIRAGRRTEIDYYNGYILTQAAKLGIECPHNEMIVSLVKAKQTINSRQNNSYIPFKAEH